MSHHDVVVVGAGLAGLTAAVRLAEGGARVLRSCQGRRRDPPERGHDRRARLRARARRASRRGAGPARDRPSIQPGRRRTGAAAVEWFKARVVAGSLAPYAYEGGLEENLLLPTALGVPRPSAVVPETMAGGDLRDDAAVLRRRLPRAQGLPSGAAGRRRWGARASPRARGGARSRARGPRRRQLARATRAPSTTRDFRTEVGAQLVGAPAGRRARGVPRRARHRRPARRLERAEHSSARPVFEVPTLPPSVPGMRLFAILRDALRRARRAPDPQRRGHRRGAGGRPGRRAARARRAARGAPRRRLGRAGHRRVRVRRARARLPLDRARDCARPARRRRPGARRGALPAAATSTTTRSPGLAWQWTRCDLRPEGHENVLVAGATLAGAEPWREKSGDGISLATGHHAAELVWRRPAAGRTREELERWTCLATCMRGSLDHCVKCTICETFCPVSNVTPLFPGPKYVGPQAERFRVAGEPSFDASLDYCSGCGVCTQVCPQGVHIAEINTQARARLRETNGRARSATA